MKLLIADDDLAVRESLKKVLEETGYEVLCAADGEEAESTFTSQRIDLLLLDLDLPKQNGWNVFGLVSALNPLVPIIIITGLGQELDFRLAPGVSAFFEKPIEVPALLETIKDLLSE